MNNVDKIEMNERKCNERLQAIWEKYGKMPPSKINGIKTADYDLIMGLRRARDGAGNRAWYPSLLEQDYSAFFFPVASTYQSRAVAKFYDIWQRYGSMPPPLKEGRRNPEYRMIMEFRQARKGSGLRKWADAYLGHPFSSYFFPSDKTVFDNNEEVFGR